MKYFIPATIFCFEIGHMDKSSQGASGTEGLLKFLAALRLMVSLSNSSDAMGHLSLKARKKERKGGQHFWGLFGLVFS